MKKIALLVVLAAASMTAGPLKVATYPFRKGPMAKVEVFSAKVLYHIGKALAW